MKSAESNWPSWLAKAENDLLCIRNNLASKLIPWDTVCYHGHQAAEKMLKAFLVSHGHQPRKTHDLVALLQECVRDDPTLSELTDDCEALNAFSIAVRYPDDLLEPGEDEGRMAADAANRGARSRYAAAQGKWKDGLTHRPGRRGPLVGVRYWMLRKGRPSHWRDRNVPPI